MAFTEILATRQHVRSFTKTKISFDTFSLYHRWIGGKSDFDIHSTFRTGHVDN